MAFINVASTVAVSWQGAWATSTSYSLNDMVSNDGTAYICTQAHTSGAASEPGTGGSWESYWDLFASSTITVPGSSTDNAVVRFNGTGGATIQNSGVTIDDSNNVTGTAFLASSNDSGALGASGTAFSDLFLASGGVINFNAGNFTATHSAGLLTFSGDIVISKSANTYIQINAVGNGTNAYLKLSSNAQDWYLRNQNNLYSGALYVQYESNTPVLQIATTGVATFTSTTSPQHTIQYDASNRLDVSVSSAGAVTFNAVGASAGFTFSDKITASGEVEIDGDFNHDGTNFGVCGTTPQAQQAHIIDADGSLADITTKFNTLLADLEGFGFLATS